MRTPSLGLIGSLCGGLLLLAPASCAFLASQGASLRQERPVILENATAAAICEVKSASGGPKDEGAVSVFEAPLPPGETAEVKVWLVLNADTLLTYVGCDGATLATARQPYVKHDKEAPLPLVAR